MNKLQQNFKGGLKTTLLGFVILMLNFFYLTERNGDAIIFFGLLLVSFGLFFAPDDLFKGIKHLIEKNKNKTL